MNVKFLGSNKKKIAITLVIIILLLINILAASLLFWDIQLIKSPETTIKIDLIEINAEETIIQTTVLIENPNPFALIVQNLEIVTQTPEGTEVMKMFVDGGEIDPDGNKTFISSGQIGFDGQNPEVLTSTITGTVGVRFFGFIKKSMPITVSVITSLGNTIKELTAPMFNIQGEFGEITLEGINFTGIIDITNPNFFDMYIEDFSVEIETETGENVGHLAIEGGTIAAKDSKRLNAEGRILIEALNSEELIVTMAGVAGVQIAGINKSLPFSAEARLKIPQLDEILSTETPTDLIIKSDSKATIHGFVSDLVLEIHNPNKIPLVVRDIHFSIYRVDKDAEKLIGESIVGEAPVGPKNITFVTTQITMPYSKLFFSRGHGFLPDYLLLTVRANVTIPGLDFSLWIGVSGYQDLHMFS